MDHPKILFFTHDKCAPCEPVKELLKSINIRMFGKKLNIEKIDIFSNEELTRKHKVTTVPTLIIGNEILTVGICEEEVIDAILKAYITAVDF